MEEAESERLSRARFVGGVGAIAAGATIAGLHRRRELATAAVKVARLDVLAAVLVAGGASALLPAMAPQAGLATPFAPTHRRLAEHDPELQFEFSVLNKKWQEEVAAMDDELGVSTFWFPERVRTLFDEARKQEREARREELLEREAALEDEIRRGFAEEGLSSQQVLQRLSKTVYVLDFADYEFAVFGSEEIGAEADDTRRPQGIVEWCAFLRDAVGFLCSAASEFDEVVLRLASPGGSVSEYGFAASQLLRLRRANIKVTVCVDSVAASGGYMMCCTADKIVAAPFALLGSIGVVAELPNFNRVLTNRLDVDYLLFTAGKFKRTVHHLAANSQEGMDQFQEELEDIHEAFKTHVTDNRAVVDIEAASTGEAWLATQAKGKGLVDEIMTSDEYLDELEEQGFDIVAMRLRPHERRGGARLLSSLAWDFLDLEQMKTALTRILRSAHPASLAAKVNLKLPFNPRDILLRASL